MTDPKADTAALCWLCQQRPANSSEHRFKASDVRGVAPNVSPSQPVFQQRGAATNDAIGSPKSKRLTFASSICSQCNNAGTQPYDLAWERLSEHLRSDWPAIEKRGQLDLSKPFPGGVKRATLDVHLFFVKLFGCKVVEGGVPIPLEQFRRALLDRTPHPEVALFITGNADRSGTVIMGDSEVHTMTNRDGEMHGAVWQYLSDPFAIKVAYIKAGAALAVPGHRWHPDTASKIVRFSPYKGGTEPSAGPGALLR